MPKNWPPDNLANYFASESFTQFVKRLSDKLVSELSGIKDWEARDCVFSAVTDVMLRAFHREQYKRKPRLADFDSEGHFLKYVSVGCHWKVKDGVKKLRRRSKHESGDFFDFQEVGGSEPSPDETAIAHECIRLLQELLDDERLRSKFSITDLESKICKERSQGRTFASIAAEHQISTSYAHKLAKSVERKLAEILGRERG